ncbi:glycosyltransferase family protein [Parafilimonas sp.]|uniref:glycosyltransferase family protein n=1 Tax=Parafilimonas sp. TaxID=1969739 RepID=UPI0039E4D23B
MNKNLHAKKILIAPLDWGLGHATRCIVLIQNLQKLKCDITVAASGKTRKLLENEFAGITFLNLPGYEISYSGNKRFLPCKILLQVPKILKIIRYENKWLCEMQNKYAFDAVISDNRYGLYSRTITSVFITHQLSIQTNITWLDRMLQHYNYSFINCFNECWIPDLNGKLNIAGALSHPPKMPAIPSKYIGPLSRLKKINAVTINYKWMVIISGPEPQRSIFEGKILELAAKINDKFMIVRGLPGDDSQKPASSNCMLFNHLGTEEMQTAMQQSEFIISRCGYTTVMEVLSLQKKSVFIPTPGQTEQEYLAKHLFSQNWSYTFNQDDDFKLHLKKATLFNYTLPEINMEQYKDVLNDFIERL